MLIREHPSNLMDMSLRAGRLCLAPDSAFHSLQFHLAAAQPPAHFHPFCVLNQGSAVRSLLIIPSYAKREVLRAI